jgi:UDP:flavonoid glycosyltransferase YjiC (YdhE family)
MGADQPALASRARELGATIVLDHATATPQQLEDAIARVLAEPSFRSGIRAIAESFREAGGYPRAADEVFAWKQARGIH